MPPTHLSAIYPSPKRKRDPPAHIPLINTTLRIATPPRRDSPGPPSGGDSPRNAVADQLSGMTLAAPIPMSPLTPTDGVARKKPKLEAIREDAWASLDGPPAGPAPDNAPGTPSTAVPASRGISDAPSSSSPRAPARLPQPQPRTPDLATPQHPLDAPPHTQMHTFLVATTIAKPRPRSAAHPRPRKKSPSPPLSSLTWQDAEITGHLVDPAVDPEDDGTGLNGIGFKPTPALAYARAQRRRQQLKDWRARETQEARAKRSERRRRGVGGASIASRGATTVERDVLVQQGGVPRRTVKFAL